MDVRRHYEQRNSDYDRDRKKTAQTVVQLPAKDRAYITELLLAGLDDSDLEQQWIDEAKRRRDEVRSGKIKPIPAEEVYRRIDGLLKK